MLITLYQDDGGNLRATVTELTNIEVSEFLRAHICPEASKSELPRTSNPLLMAFAIQERIGSSQDWLPRRFDGIDYQSRTIRYLTCSGTEIIFRRKEAKNWEMEIIPVCRTSLADVLCSFAYVLPELKHVGSDVLKAAVLGFCTMVAETGGVFTVNSKSFDTRLW